MVSLVALSGTQVNLTIISLRETLDDLFPGQFLPPRERGNFVIDGPVTGAQFAIQCEIPRAAGFYLLNAAPRPYTEFSDFLKFIQDPALKKLAEGQLYWMSVDLIQAYGTTTDAYRFIGRVISKLAPSDAAVRPSDRLVKRFDDDIRQKLANSNAIF